MQQPKSIHKNSEDPFQLDFEKLKEEALEALQDLSGKVWTDYNEHDPGITILEQLCFVITELAYRAGFDVKDLLADENGRINERENALITPATILPSAPVTVNDYRKILLDRISELQNIWIKPTAVSGRYKMFLLPNENQDGSELSKSQEHQLLKEVWKVYSRNRSLGENTEMKDLMVLQKRKLRVHANIIVGSHKAAEKVLAEIIIRIRDYLNPSIPKRTNYELETMGMGPEEIYEGPIMKNGYILDSDLVPKLQRVNVANLVKLIMEVPEVSSVSYMQLQWSEELDSGDSIEYGLVDELIVPEGVTPQLLFYEELTHLDQNTQLLRTEEDEPDRALTIKIIKSGYDDYFAIDEQELRRSIHLRKARMKRGYRLDTETTNDSVLPEATAYNLASYSSIQNDFPAFYAINEYGVGNGKPHNEEEAAKMRKRRADANQLKGYLLIFEQMLGNFLAQLESLNDLYSLRLNEEQTYFTQAFSTSEVPNVYPLYSGTYNPKKNKSQGQEAYDQQIVEEYHQKLKQTMAVYDDVDERKGRFLDHLLALYGESFNQDALYRFNYLYYSKAEAEHHRNINKVKFLQNIVRLTRNRSSASAFLAKGTGVDKEPYRDLSGSELKVHLLLGLELPDSRSSIFRSLLRVFVKYQVRLMLHSEMSTDNQLEYLDKMNSTLDEAYVEAHALEIDIPESLPTEEDQERLLDQMQLKKYGLIDDEFLRNGLQLRNYKVCFDEATDRYHVLFLSTNDNSDHSHWFNLGHFASSKEASTAAYLLRKLLVELNTQSEGFHTVEHQMLRPQGIIDSEEFEANEVPEGFYEYSVSIVLPCWSARFHNPAFRKLAEETFVYASPAHLLHQLYWLTPSEMLDFEEIYAQWLTDKASGKRLEHLEGLRQRLIRFFVSARN